MVEGLLKNNQKLAEGAWTVIELFKTGGMAEIYEVVENSTSKHFALKIPNLESVDNIEYLERFNLEIEILKKLNHPNIMKVYYVGVIQHLSRRIPFYIMDLYQTNLLNLLREGLEVGRGLRIITSVLQGLDFAHFQAIYHRDLKPSNILVDKDNNGVLTDFGIAKTALKNITKLYGKKGTILGTVEYMSPEQITNKEITFASDIYSIGVLLYEICTGELPFKGSNDLELMRMHLEKKPVPPSNLNPIISKRLDDIILQCLNKPPAKRFKSARDLLTQLRTTEEVIYTSTNIFKGGEKIANDSFRIIDIFSQSGISEIYRTEEVATKTLHALKILSILSSKDNELVERFQKEIHILTNLDHPNIVKPILSGVYEIHNRKLNYLIMPFFSSNFRDEIKIIPINEGLRILIQVAKALEYSHTHKILHRDVKPSNILIDSNRQAYLTDFGIAKVALIDQGVTGKVTLGTSGYMSPEQIRAERVDERSDIYSFGVILYELASRQSLFPTESDIETITKHLHEKPLPPKKLNPQISSKFQKIILKCIEKDPKYRFQSFSEIIPLLEDQYLLFLKKSQMKFSFDAVLKPFEQLIDSFKDISEKFLSVFFKGKKQAKTIHKTAIFASFIVFLFVMIALIIPSILLLVNERSVLKLKHRLPFSERVVKNIINNKNTSFSKAKRAAYTLNLFKFYPAYFDLRKDLPILKASLGEKLSELNEIFYNKIRVDFPPEYIKEPTPKKIAQFSDTLSKLKTLFLTDKNTQLPKDGYNNIDDIDNLLQLARIAADQCWKSDEIINISSPKINQTIYEKTINIEGTVGHPNLKNLVFSITRNNEKANWEQAKYISMEGEKKFKQSVVLPDLENIQTEFKDIFYLHIKPSLPPDKHSLWNPDILTISFNVNINTLIPELAITPPKILITNNIKIPFEQSSFFLLNSERKKIPISVNMLKDNEFVIAKKIDAGKYELLLVLPDGREIKKSFIYDTQPPVLKSSVNPVIKNEYFKNEYIEIDFGATDNVSLEKDIVREYSISYGDSSPKTWQRYNDKPIPLDTLLTNQTEAFLFLKATDENGNTNLFKQFSPLKFSYNPLASKEQFYTMKNLYDEIQKLNEQIEKLNDVAEIRNSQYVKEFPEAKQRFNLYIKNPGVLSSALLKRESEYVSNVKNFLDSYLNKKDNFKTDAEKLISSLTKKHKEIIGDRFKALDKAVKSNDFINGSEILSEIRSLIDFVSPIKITNFSAKEINNKIRLTWDESKDVLDTKSGQTSGIENYLIITTFRDPDKLSDNNASYEWEKYKINIYEVPPSRDGFGSQNSFTIENILESQEYNIAIWAKDIQENKSPTTSVVIFILPQPTDFKARYDKKSLGIELTWHLTDINTDLIKKYDVVAELTRNEKNDPTKSIQIAPNLSLFDELFFDNQNLKQGTEYEYNITIRSKIGKAVTKTAKTTIKTP